MNFLSRRIIGGKVEYLLKWKNYPESSSTWEPIEHLTNCVSLVKRFEQSLHKKKKEQEAAKNLKPKDKRSRGSSVSSEESSDNKRLKVS